MIIIRGRAPYHQRGLDVRPSIQTLRPAGYLCPAGIQPSPTRNRSLDVRVDVVVPATSSAGARTTTRPNDDESFHPSPRQAPSVALGFALTGLTLAGAIAGFVADAREAVAWEWFFFAVAYLAGGVPASREAYRSLVEERKLDVDLLMVIAALGAASVGQAGDGAILLFLFSLSNTLQDWAMGRTRGAIEALMALNPEEATVVGDDGEERSLPIERLAPGMRIRVRPGERFPADAVLVEGFTSVDESELTGESVPVEKEPGSPLFSGTLNGDGVILARSTVRRGEHARQADPARRGGAGGEEPDGAVRGASRGPVHDRGPRLDPGPLPDLPLPGRAGGGGRLVPGDDLPRRRLAVRGRDQHAGRRPLGDGRGRAVGDALQERRRARGARPRRHHRL